MKTHFTAQTIKYFIIPIILYKVIQNRYVIPSSSLHSQFKEESNQKPTFSLNQINNVIKKLN